ncbi:hypothetical protein Y032_0181g867 [Ancylostoma ceylanicum]|uniref:SCP domain-containing protein n=1 Tax=Ancylostoma ceylanicum TaxID=53326 RepID=A0A016STB8_9BILA|nr:hypothetical protein Y032_0181g867 [Ancylostoma ceylanicum]
MFFFSDSICKRWQLASCYEQALIGPSCSTAGLTPEVRQQILDFHSGKGKTLSWDCDLEQKSYDSIKTNEVDTSSIGHPANEYAEMPGPDHTMEKNVNEALNYWWDNNKYNARDKMKAANEKVGCTYKVEAPLFHIVCAYVSILTGPYDRISSCLRPPLDHSITLTSLTSGINPTTMYAFCKMW